MSTFIGFSIVGPQVGTVEASCEMSDTDGARILTAFGLEYGPVDDGVGGLRARTAPEIVELMCQWMADQMRDRALTILRSKASRDAADAVPPIEATPVTLVE
jgi:hypothetical protein